MTLFTATHEASCGSSPCWTSKGKFFQKFPPCLESTFQNYPRQQNKSSADFFSAEFLFFWLLSFFGEKKVFRRFIVGKYIFISFFEKVLAVCRTR